MVSLVSFASLKVSLLEVILRDLEIDLPISVLDDSVCDFSFKINKRNQDYITRWWGYLDTEFITKFDLH